ncbi:MAG: high-potential iron-sulfur protein [Steroidobacteraceae bacterium]
MHKSKLARREILKNALLGTLGVQALGSQASQAATLVKLTETDPTAKALGYHLDAKKVDVKEFPTYKPTQTCGNCVQLQAGTGNERGCNLFPGKSVVIGGWCKVWVQKP